MARSRNGKAKASGQEPRAFVRNAADEAQVADGRRLEQIRRDEWLDDLFTVLSSVEGRRYVWGLLAHCSVFETPMRDGDPYRTAHAIGRGDVGRWLMQEINAASPDALFTMMTEANHRAALEARAVAPTQETPNDAT